MSELEEAPRKFLRGHCLYAAFTSEVTVEFTDLRNSQNQCRYFRIGKRRAL